MLYLLWLSYGATSLALEVLGISLCKSHIYDAVQETAKLVPGLKRDQVFAGVKTPASGGDLTSVKCKGEWLPLGITVDPISSYVEQTARGTKVERELADLCVPCPE